jgi:small subunit ribosomal protein S9
MVKKDIKPTEPVKLKGKYSEAIGRRKSAIARVRLYKNGEGIIIVNQKKIEEYFNPTLSGIATQSLRLTGHQKDLNFSIQVAGGGAKGQAGAVRHGIARTLVELEKDLRPTLKTKSLLTRDARVKERKKPGLKKARRAPQWAKR